MSGDTKTWLQGVTDFLGNIGAQLRVALSVGIDPDTGTRDAQSSVDADLEREPRSDRCVSGSHVRRYVDDSPGYLTSNGRGSLEIGAADD
ncbi:MAG: hypothetical protein ACK5RK_13465 [Betaproteobacteria bacterium]